MARESSLERACAKCSLDFVKDYMPSFRQEWTHPQTKAMYSIRFFRADDLADGEIDECFRLIDETSSQDYRGSSIGWRPGLKKREMRSSELKYILVLHQGVIKGFTSMMITYEDEDDEPVVYCYEIHLKPELRGAGLGKLLMQHVLEAGEHIDGVQKVMLTCFVSNLAARSFYDKLGFEVDPSSPVERRLRGKVVVPDYVIMSRKTTGTMSATTK